MRLVQADDELERLVAEPWNGGAIVAESGGEQQGVVGAAAKADLDAVLVDTHGGGGAHRIGARFPTAEPASLFRKFAEASATIDINEDRIEVTLGRRAQSSR